MKHFGYYNVVFIDSRTGRVSIHTVYVSRSGRSSQDDTPNVMNSIQEWHYTLEFAEYSD